MAPNVASTRLQLSYPLYAADFDTYNPDFLLVGGGGGSSATGVANKISLIDTSQRDELKEVVDIELAKDEDSVTTLAVADSSSDSLTAFAGINSSAVDLSAGKNEHLRSFKIGLPSRKRRADGSNVESEDGKPNTTTLKTQALGRTSLLKAPTSAKSESYQRILRFSPSQKPGEPRLAAIASSLSPENEIIVFHPKSNAGPDDEISHIKLERTEAEDLDLTTNEGEKGGYMLAYCTSSEVFLQQLPLTSSPNKPTSLFRAEDIASSLPDSQRPKFRAIRFLSPRHLLLLRNKPGRTGADLLVLKINKDYSQASTVLRKIVNSGIKAAVGLDVASLTESEDGQKQIAVAVAGLAGQGGSVDILTIDYFRDSGLSIFRSYKFLSSVHEGPVTRVVFSNFIAPQLPVSGAVGPQNLRLATVGVDKSVMVHRLPLLPFPSSESKNPRYVLIPPGRSEAVQTTFSVLFAIIVIGTVAFLMQVFCEIRGAVPPILGSPDWLSPAWRKAIAKPYPFDPYAVPSHLREVPVAARSMVEKVKDSAEDISSTLSSAVAGATDSLKVLVDENSKLETPKAIIVRDGSEGELSTEVIQNDADVVKEETLKKWEELSEQQKKSWKQRLVDAGHWAEHQGDAVLKGILFSELAGAVGQMVGGA
jgi:glycyl-tRNA synthetase